MGSCFKPQLKLLGKASNLSVQKLAQSCALKEGWQMAMQTRRRRGQTWLWPRHRSSPLAQQQDMALKVSRIHGLAGQGTSRRRHGGSRPGLDPYQPVVIIDCGLHVLLELLRQALQERAPARGWSQGRDEVGLQVSMGSHVHDCLKALAAGFAAKQLKPLTSPHPATSRRRMASQYVTASTAAHPAPVKAGRTTTTLHSCGKPSAISSPQLHSNDLDTDLDLGGVAAQQYEALILPHADIVDAAVRGLNAGEIATGVLIPDLKDVRVCRGR